MAKKRYQIEVKKVRWFDHEESDLVDVLPNQEGEFVQVWDAPCGTPGRRLLLAYQRTPNGPTDVCSRVYLEDGPWQLVETTGPQRTFYYRDRSVNPRYEVLLPSGRVIIDDFHAGLIWEKVYTPEFDWEKHKPIGNKHGDRAVLKRQDKDLPWFVSHYQERWEGEDLIENRLIMVEEHRGHVTVAIREFFVGGCQTTR